MTRLTVSILTPTFNRRKYIPMLIECYKNQTYPTELMEYKGNFRIRWSPNITTGSYTLKFINERGIQQLRIIIE